MKASKLTESQIAFVLKQGEKGTAVTEMRVRYGYRRMLRARSDSDGEQDPHLDEPHSY